jgi:hypothetical protein
VEQWYFGPKGEPVGQTVRAAYDRFGNALWLACYGMDRATCGAGFHGKEATYDNFGNPVTAEYFDVHGDPTTVNGIHIHLQIQDYDDMGRRTRLSKIRKDGSGFLNQVPGLATDRETLDEQGRMVEQSFYDARDKLMMGPFGYARTR